VELGNKQANQVFDAVTFGVFLLGLSKNFFGLFKLEKFFRVKGCVNDVADRGKSQQGTFIRVDIESKINNR